MSCKPYLETLPCSIRQASSAGHCLNTLGKGVFGESIVVLCPVDIDPQIVRNLGSSLWIGQEMLLSMCTSPNLFGWH